jgi:hypothetical protein
MSISRSIMVWIVSTILQAQVLETAESKSLLPMQFEVGTDLEFQTSKEGTRNALHPEIECGLSKKYALLIEPVGFVSILSKA